MLQFKLAACLALASLTGACPLAAAELPTIEEILKTYHQNKERLSHLHVQAVHIYEQGEHVSYVAEHGRDVVEHRTKPMHFIEPMEFFVVGQKYQHREPVQADRTDKELKAWRFPTDPLTPQSLPAAYRDVQIFSRSPKATPAVRIWDGDGDGRFAYIAQLHLEEWGMLHGPPLIDADLSETGQDHPINAFFSLPAENYRALGQETIDGRLLTLVELKPAPAEADQTEPLLPEAQSAETQPDADETESVTQAALPGRAFSPATLPGTRAWVDLARGALPMRIEETQVALTMRIEQVVELPNGAFFPAKTVSETFKLDPAAPQLTAEQWAEVEAGKRKPALVVQDRSTWDCSLVELKTDLGDDFFAFAFPERQTIYDQDTGKIVGALEVKPLVKVGQPAPPLCIGRWVDGKERTLAGLRGQVVVLDFGTVQTAQLKALQKRFAGKPVVFITIYTAEQDAAARAAKIEKLQQENQFQFIAAIDAGWAHENSATRCEYGVGICPQMVIIDREGKIFYVDPLLDGPRCDEQDQKIVAAWKEAVNQQLRMQFIAVGETWPLPNGLSQEAESAACQRVNRRYIAQRIEAALAAKH
jgi:hypothetical protein